MDRKQPLRAWAWTGLLDTWVYGWRVGDAQCQGKIPRSCPDPTILFLPLEVDGAPSDIY